MANIVRRGAARLLGRLDLYSLYLLRVSSQLQDDGWFRSFRERKAVDARGEPLPWWTYSAIRFLEPRLKHDMRVFEYGCGSSTLWLGQRLAHVAAVEHDPDWHRFVLSKAPKNVVLALRPLQQGYESEVARGGVQYDVVIIDGRDRVKCAKACVHWLNDRGVIVWDNADRSEYAEGYDFLQSRGFRRLDLASMGPINTYAWMTSIFYREANCLDI